MQTYGATFGAEASYKAVAMLTTKAQMSQTWFAGSQDPEGGTAGDTACRSSNQHESRRAHR